MTNGFMLRHSISIRAVSLVARHNPCILPLVVSSSFHGPREAVEALLDVGTNAFEGPLPAAGHSAFHELEIARGKQCR
jgi:hypothetical protein